MKKRHPGRLNGCGMGIKYALLVGNFVFALTGCIVIGTCTYLAVDKVSFVTSVIGTPLVTCAVYIVLAAGCFMFFVSFLGCFGSFYESRRILFIYTICLTIIFFLALIGGVMAIVFRSWITDQIRTYMRSTLQYNYGMEGDYNKLVTESWDTAQQKWYCCAVEDQSWGIYRSSEWYKVQPGIPEATKPLVPETCCKKDQYGQYVRLDKCQTYLSGPPGIQSGKTNEALFYRGCYVAGTEILYQVAGYIIAIGLTIAMILFNVSEELSDVTFEGLGSGNVVNRETEQHSTK